MVTKNGDAPTSKKLLYPLELPSRPLTLVHSSWLKSSNAELLLSDEGGGGNSGEPGSEVGYGQYEDVGINGDGADSTVDNDEDEKQKCRHPLISSTALDDLVTSNTSSTT